MLENILTRNYFNSIAQEWETKQAEQREKIEYLLSRINLQRYDFVLDVGCGTGVLFPYLAKFSNGKTKIFAIDFARSMIQSAAQKNFNSIHILCGCARYLPFPNNMFDCIIAFHVLPHIRGKKLALKECWRVLKSHGELDIIHLHSSYEINAIHEKIGGTVKNHKLASAGQMAKLLHQINFKISDSVDRSGEYYIRATKSV